MAFWRAYKESWQDWKDIYQDVKDKGPQAREEHELDKERKQRRKEQIEVSCDLSQIVSIVNEWFYSPHSVYDQPYHAPFRTRLLKAVCQMQQQQPEREIKIWGWKNGLVVDGEKPMRFAKADILHELWKYIDQPRQYDERHHQLQMFCSRHEKHVEIMIKPPGPSWASIPEPEMCYGPPGHWQ